MLLKNHPACSYPFNTVKCIKVSENIQYLLQGLILYAVVTSQQTQDFCESSEPIFGKFVADISMSSLSITCNHI